MIEKEFKTKVLNDLEEKSKTNLVNLDLSIKLAKMRLETSKKMKKEEKEQVKTRIAHFKENIQIEKLTLKLIQQERDAL